MVRLTDRPDMTLDVYRGRKTTMQQLTCTTITSVDLAHYGVSRAKDWISVDCGTREAKHTQRMVHMPG